MTTSIASLFNGKHAVAAVILVLVPMLPALLLAPLGWADATAPFLLATFAGLMATLFAGVGRGLMLTAALAVAGMLALPAAPSPFGAGLVMGTTALVYGLSARRGLTGMIAMAPVAIAFLIADPPTFKQDSMLADVLVLGLFLLLGGLWGTVLGSLLGRKVPRKTPSQSSWRTAIMFGVIMFVVTGVTMAIVVATGIGHTGAWILLTIILVVQPAMGQTYHRSLERALGTALGFGITLAVALLVHNATVLLVLGIVFLTVAVYVKLDPRSMYWHFTTFLTAGIVLAEGSSADVLSLDIDRLWASFAGIAIALVLLAIFRVAGVRDKENETQKATADDKSAGATPAT